MPSSTLSSITASSFRPFSRQHAVERMRLRHRARKAVENEAVAGIRLLDAVGDDRHHHVVRNEFAARHDVLGAQPDGRPGIDGRAQHVAGGKLHHSMLGNEPLSLSAFAGPRRAEQD